MTSTTISFSIQHTPQIPELLAELKCSLVLTTYQAGKEIMLSSEGERLIQLPWTFEEPMGLAVEAIRLNAPSKHHARTPPPADSERTTTHTRSPQHINRLRFPAAR